MNPFSRSSSPSDMALRGIAIVMVVINHASVTTSRPVHLGGGLNILLLLSGYSFARFVLSRGEAAQVRRGIASFAWHVWWPTTAIILLSFALKREWSWSELLFVSNLYTPQHVSLMYVWFPQVLMQMLLALYVLSFIPGAAWAVARKPMALSLALLAITFALLLLFGDHSKRDFADRSIEHVAWNFVLGWVAWYATRGSVRWNPAARLALLAGTIVLSRLAFGWGVDWLRSAALPVAFAVLMFVPRITVPKIASRGLAILSQAAFSTFLLHVFFLRVFDALHLRRVARGFDAADTLLAAGFAVAGSVAAWIALTSLNRAWKHCIRQARIVQPASPGPATVPLRPPMATGPGLPNAAHRTSALS